LGSIDEEDIVTEGRRVNVVGLARLPSFSHAVVAGDYIFVSGTLGTPGDELEVVPGGTGPETEQTLRNIERILFECGATLGDVVKVNVFVSNLSTFAEMNEAYLRVFGEDPPARITVGRAELALGASVEIDCIAYRPRGRGGIPRYLADLIRSRYRRQ
jgi:2-iminobutanoate/2-iminopropanoate deaminase